MSDNGGHIYALDPKVKPVRRRIMGAWAKVTPILYTSRKRCMGRPNPKRPTWGCKAAPVHLVQWKATLIDGERITPGGVFCDDCLNRLRKMPAVAGEWRRIPRLAA